jgi:hypothetical protein
VARTKTKAGGEKVRYKYIFAGRAHQPITKISELRGWGDNLGFYAYLKNKWTPIGDGQLCLIPGSRGHVHTDATGLEDEFRDKGHGIHLYFALIRAAKEIGAKRVYSGHSLNQHSGPMWCTKLREFFDVRGPKDKKSCSCKCRNCRRKWGRYYIDLTKLKLRSIPL